MEYTVLDKTARLAVVRNRIRELENQHFNLAVRVTAPDLSHPVSEMDQQNLNLLESSLDQLRAMDNELSSSAPTPR